METSQHKVQLTTGSLVLKSPCHVGPEAFTPSAEGNKFCRECKKVVYDMTKLSEIEIKALFAANQGKVCGSILLPSGPKELEYFQESTHRKPLYWKQLAAAASFVLLTQSVHTKPISKPSIAWQVLDAFKLDASEFSGVDPHKTNTLVTGIIMNQDSQLVPLDLPVLIYSGKVLIAEVKTSHGLFKVDLGNKLKPDAIIEIVVKGRKNDANAVYLETYGAGKTVTRLGDAQNVIVKVEYHFPMRMLGDIGWEDADVPLESPESQPVNNSKSQL
jgi:hypothetical protein